MRKPLISALPALAALVALAGCGEKSEPPTTGPVVPQATSPGGNVNTTTAETTTTTPTPPPQNDRKLAIAAARAFFSSPDAAAVCDDGVTPKFLKTAYGDRSGCLEARKPKSLADSVEFSGVVIKAPTASMTADAKGGVYASGEKVQLKLVSSGGTWLISAVSSNEPAGP